MWRFAWQGIGKCLTVNCDRPPLVNMQEIYGFPYRTAASAWCALVSRLGIFTHGSMQKICGFLRCLHYARQRPAACLPNQVKASSKIRRFSLLALRGSSRSRWTKFFHRYLFCGCESGHRSICRKPLVFLVAFALLGNDRWKNCILQKHAEQDGVLRHFSGWVEHARSRGSTRARIDLEQWGNVR